MPTALIHRIGAAAVMAVAAKDASDCGRTDHWQPTLAACGGAVFGTLPDLLEPALSNPHHRQFFHSVACAAAIGYLCYRLYEWKPESPIEQIMRTVLLLAGGSFLTHLAMDALSPRGLPLLGRI